MIGLEKGIVRLVAYSPEWKQLFEVEKAQLLRVVGAFVMDIQHVGSTAIPGMIAKPIIDIAIGVLDFDEAKICIPLVEECGYEYRGEFGIPRRHYFSKGDPRTFHIHMTEISSVQWQNLLLFRDYLVQHAEVALAYATLKAQLAVKFPRDRNAYLEGKADFIDRVIRQARGES